MYIYCVFVLCSEIKGSSQVKWRRLLNDLVTLCFRVSDVVLPVVSNSSPEGNIPDDVSEFHSLLLLLSSSSLLLLFKT